MTATTATAITAALLSAALVFTAAQKLSHRAPVVESYARVGVPEDRLNQLALILLAGAAGLLLGLFWEPVGIAAAIGLVAYFLLAVGAHIRHGDIEHIATPIAVLALAIATLVLMLG